MFTKHPFFVILILCVAVMFGTYYLLTRPIPPKVERGGNWEPVRAEEGGIF